MQSEFTRQLIEISEQTLSSVKELSAINVRLMTKIAEQQQTMMNMCMDASAKELNILSAAKTPAEAVEMQSKLSNEYNAKFVDLVRDTSDLLAECREELGSWMENGVERLVAPLNASKRS